MTALKKIGGAKEGRTPDLNAASVALYQLSYGPIWIIISKEARILPYSRLKSIAKFAFLTLKRQRLNYLGIAGI